MAEGHHRKYKRLLVKPVESKYLLVGHHLNSASYHLGQLREQLEDRLPPEGILKQMDLIEEKLKGLKDSHLILASMMKEADEKAKAEVSR